MITNGEKCHYLAVKSLSVLLRRITSKHKEDFYCLNCFRSYTKENKLRKHKNVCENHDYCYVEIPEEDNKILKYNHGEKSMRAQFIIYADLECLLEKISTCHNNPKKLSTTKVNKHTPSGYSLFTCCSFDTTENKLDCYKGKNCMKNFCLDLERRFDTSNYEVYSPLPKGKNKKVIGLMKDELGGKIMTKFVALPPKTYSYLIDDDSEAKKAKGTKKCVIKKVLKFNDYKDCLLKNEIVLKSQQRFKSERHNVYTEEINKIALSSNDDKRLQTYDRITSYPYGISAGKVCKTELLSKVVKM